MTAPTPDELAAIRARHYPDDRSDPMCAFDEQHFPCDATRLLAAVAAEQQRRERVEAAARAFLYEGDLTEAEANAIPDDEWSEAALALRAALVTDTSEGEAT